MQNRGMFLFVLTATGLVSVLTIQKFGISVLGIRGILLWFLLLAASLADSVTYQIPDWLHIAGILLYILTLPAETRPFLAAGRGLFHALLLSGGFLALSLFLEFKTGKENLGGGDVKLFFMTGLYLKSVWEILFYINLSCIFGLFMAAFRRTERIPFAPAIAAACICVILYGDIWTRWYMALF